MTDKNCGNCENWEPWNNPECDYPIGDCHTHWMKITTCDKTKACEKYEGSKK